MIPLLFAGFVALSVIVSLTDWRRGWLLAVLCGALQDPVRKLTPGSPVVMTFTIVAIYIAIIFAIQSRIQLHLRDFSRRFPSIWKAFGLLFLLLILAAINGLATFGIGYWRAPMLSLFTYLAPLPAVLLGYMYLDREQRLYRFFTFYSIITSIFLIGSLLEYLRVDSRTLGMVMQVGDYIRHLPGLQIRMISGFYRAPDIMGWHAAMLTSISLAMAVRSELGRRAIPWMLGAGWGFFNCMISGRRKAIYFVLVFVIAFLLRYIRRIKPAQIVSIAVAAAVLGYVVHNISTNETSSVYATGAVTTGDEVAQRLEGGLLDTIAQFGFMGAGLGTATQGVQYLLGPKQTMGWQEGGLGKLAIELGVPGLLAAMLFAYTALRTMMKISAIPDHPYTSQIGRATLFALIVANIANFAASAQAYSDPVLTLITCFIAGCLFATITLDERAAAAAAPPPALPQLTPVRA
ncbi:MAG: hypothetical protein JWO97_2695 [Acidobacteria bacterium]|nr:hypothetical protein [Acidobacteriota bacterium]